MAKHAVLQTFYASDAWRAFRLTVIAERGTRCEHCRERVAKAQELTLHHIIELTPENVNDAMIALNPDNVLVVHHGCHNQIHKRNAAKRGRQVFIVYGPPLSGKTTFVRENMEPGDLVVDYDRIYQAVSGLDLYDKPNELLPHVRAVHSLLLDHIKTRFGKWQTAWIIGGYADHYRREKLTSDLGAELLHMEATRDQCIKRLKQDKFRKNRETEWIGYIDRWFSEYTAGGPLPVDPE